MPEQRPESSAAKIVPPKRDPRTGEPLTTATPSAAQDQEPMTVESLVAQARVVQSELAWLGGFLETGVPDRPDLPKRTDRAYRVIELLIEEVTP